MSRIHSIKIEEKTKQELISSRSYKEEELDYYTRITLQLGIDIKELTDKIDKIDTEVI